MTSRPRPPGRARSRRPVRSGAPRAAPPAPARGRVRANTRASAAPMPGGSAGDHGDRRIMRSRVRRWSPAPATRWRNAMRSLRRHAEQIGGAPDQIVLEFGDRAVGIDDLPHHLDHAQRAPFSSSERLSSAVK